MNIPYVMKRCTECGRWLVASAINFRRTKTGKYGLRSKCKECDKQYREINKEKIIKRRKRYYEANKEKEAEQGKQWRQANKDKIAEYHKQYYESNKDKIAEYHKQYCQDNKDKIAEHHKQYREANKEKIAKYKKQYCEANKDKIVERQKQYYETNKDKIVERQKQYYESNKDKIAKRSKQYYKANKDKIAEQQKQYHQSPQGQVASFNSNQRRRTKEQRQGNGITKDQWKEVMSFFNWKCAYSGETLTKDTRSLDHIIPLNNGGEHEIWNLVPMTQSLNSSKKDKEMLEWYKEQDFYSEARLAKIYEWKEHARKKMEKIVKKLTKIA